MPNANAKGDQDAHTDGDEYSDGDEYTDANSHFYADAIENAHTDCHTFPGDGLYAWLLEDPHVALAEDAV